MALAHAARRRGAKRRDEMACRGPAMTDGRCRMPESPAPARALPC